MCGDDAGSTFAINTSNSNKDGSDGCTDANLALPDFDEVAVYGRRRGIEGRERATATKHCEEVAGEQIDWKARPTLHWQ